MYTTVIDSISDSNRSIIASIIQPCSNHLDDHHFNYTANHRFNDQPSTKSINDQANHTVNDSRNVAKIKSLGKLKVELDCGALDGSSEGVFDGDVDFGAVKSAISGIQLPLGIGHLIQAFGQL